MSANAYKMGGAESVEEARERRGVKGGFAAGPPDSHVLGEKFLEAAALGELEVLQGHLRSKYLTVDYQGHDSGHTALHMAVMNGRHHMAQALIESMHCNVEIQDHMGRTALDYACRRASDLKTVKMLLKFGTNPNLKTRQGRTPLHTAVRHNHREYVQPLVEYGCKIDSMDEYGHTAMHEAAHGSRDECMVELIACGAKVDPKDKKGYTPLHLAASGGHKTACRRLYANGASLTYKNKEGMDAAAVASAHDYDLRQILAGMEKRSVSRSPEVRAARPSDHNPPAISSKRPLPRSREPSPENRKR